MRALPPAGLLFYSWTPKKEDVIAWVARKTFLFLLLLHGQNWRNTVTASLTVIENSFIQSVFPFLYRIFLTSLVFSTWKIFSCPNSILPKQSKWFFLERLNMIQSKKAHSSIISSNLDYLPSSISRILLRTTSGCIPSCLAFTRLQPQSRRITWLPHLLAQSILFLSFALGL